MKLKTCTEVLALALLLITGAAHAGHESGGRIAASTIFLRFTSRGEGINSTAARAVDAIAKAQTDAGHVADYRTRSWGREGEFDLCLQMKNPGYRVQAYEAIDRAIRLNADKRGGAISSTVNASSCEEWPMSYSGLQLGAFSQFDPEHSSLRCEASADEPEGYHLSLKLYELLDEAGKPTVRYVLQQSARAARYRQLSGQVSKTSVETTRGTVTFHYVAEPFTLSVNPTTAVEQGATRYDGVVKLGTQELPVQCASGRRAENP